MFALSADDLSKRIVSVGDGPASFNAEMTSAGRCVLSMDPLYRFTAQEIRARVEATSDVLVAAARKDAHRFVWDRIASPDALRVLRLNTMGVFLADYDLGKREGRYNDGSLPALRLDDHGFDLAICSHFLFLYSAELSFTFHFESIIEMLRIATEVRVFPLLNMDGVESEHLTPLVNALRDQGYRAERVCADYEFQRGGNEFLRVGRMT